MLLILILKRQRQRQGQRQEELSDLRARLVYKVGTRKIGAVTQ